LTYSLLTLVRRFRTSGFLGSDFVVLACETKQRLSTTDAHSFGCDVDFHLLVDASCCSLSVALTYDSLDTDPRTRAHSLRDVAATGFAAGRLLCSRRLSHWIAVAATQTRAAAESRNHTSDERAEQWQTCADNGNVGFDYGPAKSDSTVVCDGVSIDLEKRKREGMCLPNVRILTSDIITETSSLESGDTHDGHDDDA
jgi:hypothetical protein